MPDEHIVAGLLLNPHLGNFYDQLNDEVFCIAIDEAVEKARQSVGWTRELAHSAFRYLAWTQDLDVDLTQPLSITQPAPESGMRNRSMLQRELFGWDDHA
jgi:hypothetical protein